VNLLLEDHWNDEARLSRAEFSCCASAGHLFSTLFTLGARVLIKKRALTMATQVTLLKSMNYLCKKVDENYKKNFALREKVQNSLLLHLYGNLN